MTPETEPVLRVWCADDIMRRLLDLPGEISRAEEKLIDAEMWVISAKTAVQAVEDTILLASDSPINGKNEAIRAAQVRFHTEDARCLLHVKEEATRDARRRYNLVLNTFSALRAVARMLEGARE